MIFVSCLEVPNKGYNWDICLSMKFICTSSILIAFPTSVLPVSTNRSANILFKGQFR